MLYRWFKFAGKIVKANFGTLAQPFKLTYVVTKECHSKCLNCDIWKIKPKGELTLEEISSFAEKNRFFSWIDFTGGEPTDRKDFVELIEVFQRYSKDLLFVHFPTNGLKPKRIISVCEQLIKNKTPGLTVTVSIDGPQAVNDKLRGIPGDFLRAVEVYQHLSTMSGLKVYVGMTLYQENMHLIEEEVGAIKSIIPKFSVRNLHINLPHTSEHYYGNTNASPSGEPVMADIFDDFMKKRGFPRSPFDIIERLYANKVRRYVTSKLTPIECSSLMSSVFMSENGTIYPCNIWNKPLGNIRDTDYSLEPIIHSSLSKDTRKQIIEKDCPNCWTPCEAYQSLLSNITKL